MPRQQKMIRQPNAAEEVMKREAFDTMRSARTEMLMRFPFLGELAMQLKIIPVLDERLPVACTDGAAVYVNASTRFTDGGEFGLGAEIGISTQKLHARGPMGINELTSMKFIIKGSGQVRV